LTYFFQEANFSTTDISDTFLERDEIWQRWGLANRKHHVKCIDFKGNLLRKLSSGQTDRHTLETNCSTRPLTWSVMTLKVAGNGAT